jgi:hypothetical protein
MPKLHGKTLVLKLLRRRFAFFCKVKRRTFPECSPTLLNLRMEALEEIFSRFERV